VTSIPQLLRRVARAAGLRDLDGTDWIRPHVLRRSGASIAVQAGVSPLVAKEQLGHARLDVTERHYLRVDADAMLDAYSDVFTARGQSPPDPPSMSFGGTGFRRAHD
jgi:integrase